MCGSVPRNPQRFCGLTQTTPLIRGLMLIFQLEEVSSSVVVACWDTRKFNARGHLQWPLMGGSLPTHHLSPVSGGVLQTETRLCHGSPVSPRVAEHGGSGEQSLEDGSSLAFLDCPVHIEGDGSLNIRIYRKPTHTDSLHPLEHKLGSSEPDTTGPRT